MLIIESLASKIRGLCLSQSPSLRFTLPPIIQCKCRVGLGLSCRGAGGLARDKHRAECALSTVSLPGIEMTVQERPCYACRVGGKVCILTCTQIPVLAARLVLGRLDHWALTKRRQSHKPWNHLWVPNLSFRKFVGDFTINTVP